MNNLTIFLPSTERETILAALAVAEARADDLDRPDCTPLYRIHGALLIWLRAALTNAGPGVQTAALNNVIRVAREIIATKEVKL